MPKLMVRDRYSYGHILRAYLDCRRRKRNKKSAVAFEAAFESRLYTLLEEINSGQYKIGPSQVFVVTRPKAREVWAASFRDRIIHHLVYNDIGRWFEARFIEHSCSCIIGRGTGFATQALNKMCRSITHNWTKPAWYLQLDIANYFVSINRKILWKQLSDVIGHSSLTARLLQQIIFHDATQNPIIKTPHLHHLVPRHKSLWHCRADCGLPIGNLTSQFFSNMYLDGLDKFVKHALRIKGYVRYVDDMVLLSAERDQLHDCLTRIQAWLADHLGLCIHPHKIKLAPLHGGINFVGRVVLPYRTYVRKSTVHAAKEAAKNLAKSPASKDAFASCQSYIGMMHGAQSYNVRKHLCHTAAVPTLVGHSADYSKIIQL